MRKKAAAQPAIKDAAKASEVATPVVDANVPVTVEAVPAEPKKQVAKTAALEKAAPKLNVTKKSTATKSAMKTVTDKPASTPKNPTKMVKKAPATMDKVAEAATAMKRTQEKKKVPKKPKLVRDSFTLPEADYALFATLKQRALSAGVEVKKSEILRAAVVGLSKLADAGFLKAIGLVERIKTGRPKK